MASYKTIAFILCSCILNHICRADTVTLPQPAIPVLTPAIHSKIVASGVPVLTLDSGSTRNTKLEPYFSAWEDTATTTGIMRILSGPTTFVPIAQLVRRSPVSTYWLSASIVVAGGQTGNYTISFNALTFVDLYLFQDGHCVHHGSAGILRPASALGKEDGRNWLGLSLSRPGKYLLMLQVRHVKHYQPVFDFALHRREEWQNLRYHKAGSKFRLQGAVWIFFIYTLISWKVSRFRPYAWLLLFITGILSYDLCTDGYMIEWFFPEHPAAALPLYMHSLHLGILGILLLTVDFWKLRTIAPRLYRAGIGVIGFLTFMVVTTLWIDLTTGNYFLANLVNLCAAAVYLSFLAAAVFFCWNRLNAAQRYLAYGLFVFIGVGIFMTLASALFSERSATIVTYFTNGGILAIFIVFSTGLKQALQQYEVDKRAALQELNRLQLHQNALLEMNVAERTIELRAANRDLSQQKELLAQKNVRIETLIDELNHRVKNNLQLLYGLMSLQLPDVADVASQNILKSHLVRIKAMMLANQKLHGFNETDMIKLGQFLQELFEYQMLIFDAGQGVKLELDLPADVALNARYTLSLGLIFSELLTNSYKYAFAGVRAPSISIAVRLSRTGELICHYADNGIGIKGHRADERSQGSMLVQDLVRQMEGYMTVGQGQGVSYDFSIPLPAGQPYGMTQ